MIKPELRSVYRRLLDAARELADQGTFTYADDQVGQNDLNDIFRGPHAVRPMRFIPVKLRCLDLGC
ncbi:hypothetical protein ACFQO7_14950 [Catellatospora aurea]|uniref:Uncharacterized protein n=1 Tax=Catellatospora aurea TaxID=1337874 RepID=A0ABW2GUT4_9ACTN